MVWKVKIEVICTNFEHLLKQLDKIQEPLNVKVTRVTIERSEK